MSPETHPNVDVYIAGYNADTAVYWKNGIEFQLTDGSAAAVAYAITVIDTNIYVAGFRFNGQHTVATYWKNGVAISLTDGLSNAQALGIAISGNDVYVAGYVIAHNNNAVATYWKNGQQFSLTDSANHGHVNGIAISGDRLILAGDERNDTAAAYTGEYWDNGKPIALTSLSKGSSATAVTIADGNIYIAGATTYTNPVTLNSYGVSCYWVNGKETDLTDGQNSGGALCISATGGNLYIGGFENLGPYNNAVGYAKYWKNKNEVTVNSNPAYTSAVIAGIAVAGSDVYTAGYQTINTSPYIAVYWKNGISYLLAKPSPYFSSGANAIFLKVK